MRAHQQQQRISDGLLLGLHARQTRCCHEAFLHHHGQQYQPHLVLLQPRRPLSEKDGWCYQPVSAPI